MEDQDLTFSDFLPKIGDLGKGEWVTVYSGHDGMLDGPVFYSALIREDQASQSLQDPGWDFRIGSGAPGFSMHYEDGKEVTTYFRPSDEGIEPLVLWREFHGIRPGYWEVAEEFRLYFNLYDDRQNNKLLFIDNNGDEHDAVLMSATEIKIKGHLIKEYLAAKNMRLALFFDFNRFSEKALEELGLHEYHEHRNGDDFSISIGARPWSGFAVDPQRSHGFLMGKKLVLGDPNFKPDFLRRGDRKYVEFIIGVDDNGKEVLHTCEEDKLANYFGKNPGAPQYVTPVFFRKEVLNKYYSQPDKYTVDDGNLRCGGLWSLRMDNNHPESVMVFLGDLGHLSYSEQFYWRGFNLSSGKMSRTAFERSIMGQFSDPENVDLFFKQQFSEFNRKWKKRFGWDLLKPMTDKDSYYFKILRIPLTNDQREFDEQILALTKVFIDSLNEQELGQELTLKPDAKGLDKFEAWLRAKCGYSEKMVEFMRKLQALRSAGSAHRKGEKYERVKKFFQIGEKNHITVLEDILVKCVWTLNTAYTIFRFWGR